MSWGEVVGKVFNWIPKREEHRRNRIEAIEKEMDEILKSDNTVKHVVRLERLRDELRKLNSQAKNS